MLLAVDGHYSFRIQIFLLRGGGRLVFYHGIDGSHDFFLHFFKKSHSLWEHLF